MPVIALVMPAGTDHQLGIIRDVFQELSTDNRMRFDDGKFLFCQPSLLVDNRILNADLAHVVQQAYHVNAVLLRLAEACASGDFTGIARHARGMAVGVFVLGVHRGRQRLNDLNIRAGKFFRLDQNFMRHVPVQTVQFDGIAHAPQHHFGGKGFAYEIGRTRLQPGCLGLHVLVSGQENHRHAAVRGTFPNLLQQLNAVCIRHMNVQKEKIGRAVRLKRHKQLAARAEIPAVYSRLVEYSFDQSETHRVVVNNGNQLIHAFPPVYPAGAAGPGLFQTGSSGRYSLS